MHRILCVLLLLVGVTALVPQARAQDTDKNRVSLTIMVPQSDAKLTFDGHETKMTGVTRKFQSPAIEGKGVYSYTLQTVWKPNNYTTITRTRVVDVEPGQAVEVDLRKPDKRWKDDIVVRYVPTPNEVVDAMCKMAKVGKDDIVYDLGCGDGRMVIRAVEKFGAKRGVGIDLDPERVSDSLENAKKSKVANKLEFRQGDVLKVKDLPDATVVLLYMGDDINRRLQPILQSKLKPGSRVVSHRFLMNEDWPPTRTESMRVDGENYDIHLWIIGEKMDEK